jgi:phosphate transport system protein
MPIYEQKLQNDITAIKREVAVLGGMVRQALADSVTALFNGDEQLANLTVLRDYPINRQYQKLNRQCHNFIARHLPSAGHLRLVTSVIQMIIDLERVGDYARTVSRETIHMHYIPEGVVLQNLQQLARQAQDILQNSLLAFDKDDVTLARTTLATCNQGSKNLNAIFQDLTSVYEREAGRDAAVRLLDLHSIAYMLERVGNRAANVCEEVLFILAGETVAARRHDILFLDQDGASLAPLAAVMASKGYGQMARFRSAGQQASAAFPPHLLAFLQHHGLSLQDRVPCSMATILPDIDNVDIIVSLQGAFDKASLRLPFHTTLLEWKVGEAPSATLSTLEAVDRYEEIFRILSVQLGELMTILIGETES